jgi:hypothetical protein
MFSLFMSFERDMRATLGHYVVSTLGIDDTLGELVENALLRQIKGDDPDSSLEVHETVDPQFPLTRKSKGSSIESRHKFLMGRGGA